MGWWGGVVCTVIFMSNPTTVLRLCCVVVGVVTINNLETEFYKYSKTKHPFTVLCPMLLPCVEFDTEDTNLFLLFESMGLLVDFGVGSCS